MLLSHDMLNVKQPVDRVLREAAVLATINRAVPHEFPKCLVDHAD